MDTTLHKENVRRWVDAGFNAHDVGAFDEYFATDLVNHALPPEMPGGLAGTKLLAQMFFTAFPDITLQIKELVARDDRLLTYWSARGTHRGELMGIPPTEKQVTFSGMAVDRFEDDRSVEHWEIIDQLDLMTQLGVLSAPS